MDPNPYILYSLPILRSDIDFGPAALSFQRHRNKRKGQTMIFLPRVSPMASAIKTFHNSPTLTISAARSISSTARLNRGAMEVTKDAAHKVNEKTSDAALRGIEKGGKAFPCPSSNAELIQLSLF